MVFHSYYRESVLLQVVPSSALCYVWEIPVTLSMARNPMPLRDIFTQSSLISEL